MARRLSVRAGFDRAVKAAREREDVLPVDDGLVALGQRLADSMDRVDGDGRAQDRELERLAKELRLTCDSLLLSPKARALHRPDPSAGTVDFFGGMGLEDAMGPSAPYWPADD